MSVWTFIITAGPQIKVSLPDNPPLDYSGNGQHIWKVVTTEKMAEAYARGLKDLGFTLKVYTEEMTEEMLEEKALVQGKS